MLPAYEQYKNTGYQWLPEIPENWQMLRGKNLFEDVDVRSKTGEEELLTVSHITGVTPRKQKTNVTMFQAESLEGYKLCEPGDFVANTMWVWMGAIAVSKYAGLVSPAYNVYRQKTENYDPVYLDYLLRVHSLISEYKRRSTGVRSSRLRLYPEELLRIGFPLPPLVEQRQIIRYLDSKISRINHLISLKKREIALLQEKKQAIISHAVTKGLDTKAEMKDSGVEWIGEIPKGWNVQKLRSLLSPISIKNRADLPLLSVVRERGVILRNVEDIEENHNFIPEDLSNYKVVSPGQFVINKMKAWQGSYGISQYNGIVSPAYFVFDLHSIDPSYFHLAVRCQVFINFFTKASDGVRPGQWDLDLEKVKNIPFFIPILDDQVEICGHVVNKLNNICQYEYITKLNIEKLIEYKSCLISDVVTGKINVQNITVSDPLPEDSLYSEKSDDEMEIPDDEE